MAEPLYGVIYTHTRYVPSADYNTALCWGGLVVQQIMSLVWR
jgi:hypothetical protein